MREQMTRWYIAMQMKMKNFLEDFAEEEKGAADSGTGRWTEDVSGHLRRGDFGDVCPASLYHPGSIQHNVLKKGKLGLTLALRCIIITKLQS